MKRPQLPQSNLPHIGPPLEPGQIVLLSVIREPNNSVTLQAQPGLDPVELMSKLISDLYKKAVYQLQNSFLIPPGARRNHKNPPRQGPTEDGL